MQGHWIRVELAVRVVLSGAGGPAEKQQRPPILGIWVDEQAIHVILAQ